MAEAQTLYQVDSTDSDSVVSFIRPPDHLTAPQASLLLAEIPSDFLQLKAADFELARAWRFFSRDAMPDGGTITINTTSGDGEVRLEIADTGCGIKPEVMERIFEPFVTTKPQGTGLGLAITKRIVTAHHGAIKANSFPGGTVIHVLLPIFEKDTTSQ